MPIGRDTRQRSLELREGTVISLMNVSRSYARTPEGEKSWSSLQGRLEDPLRRSWDGPRRVVMME